MGYPEFQYSFCDSDGADGCVIHFWFYFCDAAQAEDARSTIQTICGSSVEADEEFVHFFVFEDQLVEALSELASHGFDAREVG